MVRIPYESRAIHRPKQSQQKASSCQKNGARVVSHSGERSVRIREVEGSNPFGSTKDRLVRAGLFFYAVIYTKGCSFIP